MGSPADIGFFPKNKLATLQAGADEGQMHFYVGGVVIEADPYDPGDGIANKEYHFVQQYQDSQIILAGAGGGAPVESGALTLSLSRPPVHGAPGSDPASGKVRVWFTFGTWNQRLPTNTVWYLDVDDDADRYFFAKAATASASDRLAIASWTITSGEAWDSEVTDDWGSGGELPEHIVMMLGTYHVATGKVASTGKGSIYTRDHLSNVMTSSGTTSFIRNIDIVRH